MGKTAWAICRAIDELYQACKKYKACEKCNGDDCPMCAYCLDDHTLLDIALNVTKERVEDFIEGADELTVPEDKWQEESDYWNDRRCDPEDY